MQLASVSKLLTRTAVRDIFEQLLSRPMGPQELAFLLATRTQTSCFAGQSYYEFVTAGCATRPCKS